MGSITHREWYLFIGLIASLFIIFALWSSKRVVRVPYEEKPDLNEKEIPDQSYSAGSSPVSPVIEEVEIEDHDIQSESFKSALKEKLSKMTVREEICRTVLEEIYQSPFPKTHPEFLRNNRKNRRIAADVPEESILPPITNRKLELDGYNETLSIAFECNGEFHYRPAAFTKSQVAHKYQLWKDHFKAEQCNANGVYVISIPYKTPNKQIPNYIENRLPHNVQKRVDAGEPAFDDAYLASYHMGDTEEEKSHEVSYSRSYMRSTRS